MSKLPKFFKDLFRAFKDRSEGIYFSSCFLHFLNFLQHISIFRVRNFFFNLGESFKLKCMQRNKKTTENLTFVKKKFFYSDKN